MPFSRSKRERNAASSDASNRHLSKVTLLIVAALAGCHLDVSEIPVGPALDAAMTLSDAGGQKIDAGSDAQVRDGGDEDAVVPVRHASCAVAAPASTPALPTVAVDATGRPLFDLYRDIACADAMRFATCDVGQSCASTPCLRRDEQSIGVCTGEYGGAFSWLSFDAGRCRTEITSGALARACCDALPGFECKAWPYAQSSRPGELCARHEDCESGLLCKAHPVPTVQVGICVCPDTDPSSLSNDC